MYKRIEHRSDFIIEGQNDTFEKTLADVAEGMFTEMGAENTEEKDSIEIESEMNTPEDLVVDALSKIIAECEIIPFTPKKAEVTKTGEKSLRIKITGEKKQPENIIKGATYHELKVEEKEGKWIIRVLFDI